MPIYSPSNPRLNAVLIIVFSVPFILIGAYVGQARYSIIKDGEAVTGTIVGWRSVRAGKKAPTVAFTTLSGEEYQHQDGTYFKSTNYAIGKEVTIYYMPDDPNEAILSNWRVWTFPIGFFVVGSLLLIAGFRALIL